MSDNPLDLAETGRSGINGGASFSLRNRIYRVIWAATYWTLFRPSPRKLSKIRILLLRLFGARISSSARISPTVRIWSPRNLVMGDNASMGPHVNCYNMGKLTIGARTVISQRVFLCGGTHDVSRTDFQLVTKPITIGADVWVAAEAMVGPGASIEDCAVLGARAVLFGKAQAGYIYIGNPAVKARPRLR